MKKVSLAVWFIGMLAANANAASWIVWPGQSVQTAITNASVGDNITIKQGVYVENIVLNKGLDIRGEPGNELTTSVQGTWTIQNATAPIYLKGFKIGVSVNGNVTVANCSDVRLDYITANPSTLSVVNSKFYLYRSSFSGDAAFNGGNWTLQRSTISGSLTSDNADTKLLASTVGTNVSHNTLAYDCTVFQSTVGERLSVSATNYWIGYNTIRYADIRNGGGTCEIVGNRINMRDSGSNGLYIANTSPIIRNNIVSNGYFRAVYNDYTQRWYANQGNGVYVSSGSPLLMNNVIRDLYFEVSNSGFNSYATNCANGIFVNTGCNARVSSSIIQEVSKAIQVDQGVNGYILYAPSSSEVKYSDLRGSVGGGCSPINCINADPTVTSNFVLLPGSPCIDTGDPDVQYNDLNNTRNDMGCYGGHAYDPSGLTTTNPVVIRADAAPLYIKRGQTIMLKARGAVSAD